MISKVFSCPINIAKQHKQYSILNLLLAVNVPHQILGVGHKKTLTLFACVSTDSRVFVRSKSTCWEKNDAKRPNRWQTLCIQTTGTFQMLPCLL